MNFQRRSSLNVVLLHLAGIFVALGLTAGPVAAATTASLAWNPNAEPDIAGYRVLYGTSAESLSQEIDVGAATTYTVPGLAPGGTYYFATTAYNVHGGESRPSQSLVYTVPAEPARLAWDANREPDLAGYRVYFGPTAENLSQSVDVGSATNFVIPALAPGATVYFAVTAYNAEGRESLPSSAIAYTRRGGREAVVGPTLPGSPPLPGAGGSAGGGSAGGATAGAAGSAPAGLSRSVLVGPGLWMETEGQVVRSDGGKPREFVTERAGVFVQGATLATGPVTVVYRVRHGRYRVPKGGAWWKFAARLRPGRNRIEARVLGADRRPLAGVVMVVRREGGDW